MNDLSGTTPRKGSEAFSHLGRSVEAIRAELGIEPVPVEAIRDPAVYELEREKIFRRTWLKVATDWEIPEKGDYKVKELQVADTSVLIVRGKDGVVRAFHNVCTHRGNKVDLTYRPVIVDPLTTEAEGGISLAKIAPKARTF